MRKVLVFGAALAATCLSAAAVPAAATPLPTPSAPVPTVLPSEDTGTAPPSESPVPPGEETPPESPESPSAPPAEKPAAPSGPGVTDGVVSAKAVMVTPRPPRFRTYLYGRKSSRQRVDAYWRASAPKAKPRPAVLVLHGGYWLGGDKSGWKYFARRLTDQGYVVLAANYRLAGKAPWPAQRDDAMSALEFLKKHAKAWNADPRRVVVIGSSSGGMLATQLGTYGTGSGRVRGVIALSPPNNPYLAYQDGQRPGALPTQRKLRRAVVDLVRCTPGDAAAESCWQRLDDANSTTHVSPGDAPMLLMHASGDFVPVTQSTGLASALRAAGVPVGVKVVPGDLHASELLNDEHTYPTILRWLRSHI